MNKQAKAELKARAKDDPVGEHQRVIENLRSLKAELETNAELVKCLGQVATTEAGKENAVEAADCLTYSALSDIDCAIEYLEAMSGENVCLSVLQERLGLEVDTSMF